jgi:hypothetical protein
MQIDVSGFAKVRLTFACQNGSQKRVCRGKYFQKNSAAVWHGHVYPFPNPDSRIPPFILGRRALGLTSGFVLTQAVDFD